MRASGALSGRLWVRVSHSKYALSGVIPAGTERKEPEHSTFPPTPFIHPEVFDFLPFFGTHFIKKYLMFYKIN
jgi:hypothetical protein